MTTRDLLNEIFALKYFLSPVFASSKGSVSRKGPNNARASPARNNLGSKNDQGSPSSSCPENGPVSPNNSSENGPSSVPVSNLVERYKFAPCGHLLAENIRKEWVRSCVLRREEPAFVFSQMEDRGSTADAITNLREMFLATKELSNGKVPFIVASLAREYDNGIMPLSDCSMSNGQGGMSISDTSMSNGKTSMSNGHSETSNHNPSQNETEIIVDDHEWRHYFSPTELTSLRGFLFVTPSCGQQLFYHWQSQRKYWWRKFSCDPGKISVSEDAPNKTVNIQIELPFSGGSHQVMETIVNHGTGYFEQLEPGQRDAFEIKDGRKKCLPYLIESKLSVEAATLSLLCESLSRRGERQVMRLHRKLAPYKVAFLNSNDDELKSLAQYLYENLRQSHIHCLFSPLDAGLKSPTSIESQLSVNDRLGVPYSVLIRDSALQDGLISIRNRDTTLEEKVHISKLNEYVESLLKNS
uniref:DNA polymerase subunit gamma-2, mitochondrial n=1 Tax=Cacopsylla melanoneura TaxID=428564 RepID=A0A8D8SVY0_9HEMI